MANKYEILAAKYPFNGYYSAHINCNNLAETIAQFIKLKAHGYNIIDIRYRNIKEGTL